MAARPTDKAAQRPPPRPSSHSQLSNSVPSTPYQQPRDLHFHSRSPSPRRGLGNQSPGSVASEAVEAGAPSRPYRAAPTASIVCKFETAPEWRKRRIPYVEGGEKELGPPNEEPKSALDPHDEDKLSGDMRELYDRLLPSDESEQRRAQLVKKLERILDQEWPGNDIIVSVFGSSGNLLSSSDSDVDICVTTSLKKVESMHTLAMLLHQNGMERVVCRAAAKVPIVKCWDPELQLACDVNVNNPLALENTRMIKTYVQLDPRVRPLAKIVKYWTKRRLLNDAAFGGTISSYTWICMIISFLQRRDPPVLPSLQKMADAPRSVVDGRQSQFADALDSLRGCGDANKESLAALLFNFFRHYSYEFQFSKYVISVKEGRLLSRKEKGWDNYADNKEARCRLCVEEPFNTQRNLGNSADDYAWSGIHGEIRRAFELLADGGQLDKCCEQYEFPPEEKPIFQRPAPKPKPTLTRSASQSGGRPNHEPSGNSRSRKGGSRNQSTQRSNNRRASSGAVFSNQRIPPLQSPSLSLGHMDFLTAKGNLHDHLFHQYQYLQAQQDALRSQLAVQQQQQQQQAHAQSRMGDSAGTSSPHHRQHPQWQFANPLPSPKFLENPPQTAPLLPGYLYHYPARYPAPSSPLQHHSRRPRDGDGANTNPPSPSFAAAVPALRRQANRTSVPEGSSSAMRSQSQPGRSLPHPLTLQQHAHPGYDVSGALGGGFQNVHSSQMFPQAVPAGFQFPLSSLAGMYPISTGGHVETAMSKEYVGYYVGQSPQLGPQYVNAGHTQVPAMPTLRDPPPQVSQGVMPELIPPLSNGGYGSRSPSPLGRPRGYSAAGNSRAGRVEDTNSQGASTHDEPVIVSGSAPIKPPAEADVGGPIIVNGSKPPAAPRPQERTTNGNYATAFQQSNGDDAQNLEHLQFPHTLPTRPDRVAASDTSNLEASSPRVSPNLRDKAGPRLAMSPNGPNGTAQNAPGLSEPYPELSNLSAAPLLSPVAELRTPSPTHQFRFESQDSPQHPHANGLVKTPKGAPAKGLERENKLPDPTPAPTASATTTKHERKGSAPNPTTATSKAGKIPSAPSTLAAGLPAMAEKNPWQQATGRKGHKKNKSSANTAGGQRSPVIEGERKGG